MFTLRRYPCLSLHIYLHPSIYINIYLYIIAAAATVVDVVVKNEDITTIRLNLKKKETGK